MLFLPSQPNAKADLIREIEALGKMLKDHCLRASWHPDTQRWLVDRPFTNSRVIQIIMTPRDTIHERCTHIGFWIGGVDYETPYEAGMQMLREFGVQDDLVEVVLPKPTRAQAEYSDWCLAQMFGQPSPGDKKDAWRHARDRRAGKPVDQSKVTRYLHRGHMPALSDWNDEAQDFVRPAPGHMSTSVGGYNHV